MNYKRPKFDDPETKEMYIDICKHYTRWECFDLMQDTLDELIDLERGTANG